MNYDAIAAVEAAPGIAMDIAANLKPETAAKIPTRYFSSYAWIDHITPAAMFYGDSHLYGFIYITLIKKYGN